MHAAPRWRGAPGTHLAETAVIRPSAPRSVAPLRRLVVCDATAALKVVLYDLYDQQVPYEEVSISTRCFCSARMVATVGSCVLCEHLELKFVCATALQAWRWQRQLVQTVHELSTIGKGQCDCTMWSPCPCCLFLFWKLIVCTHAHKFTCTHPPPPPVEISNNQ